jgi:bromodomain and WD repeat domain-containing protein 1/3
MFSVTITSSCPNLSHTNCCRDRNDVDVSAVYHQLLDTYKSSDSESEAKPGPSCSRNADSLGTTRRRHHEQQTRRMSRRRTAAAAAAAAAAATAAAIPTDWRRECRDLLEMLWGCEDSTPFRLPFTQHVCHKELLCCS